METWKTPKTVYSGKIFDIQSGSVTLSDGQEAIRDIVIHHGGVGIVPFTGHSVIFAKQYRIAIEQEIIEIPAGKLEGKESAETRGRAELIEEVGYIAGSMIPAGYIYPSVGFLTEKIHLFIATDLTKTEAQPELDEEIEILEIPIEEVRRKLRSNYFTDAKTIAGLHALLNHIDSL
jgi:ADP-ribose pyrophosphatase